MRTRSFAGETNASGIYTFPQPVRARSLASAVISGDSAAAWTAGFIHYAPLPTSFLMQAAEDWACIGKDVQIALDSKDHLIYAISLNKNVIDAFMLTIREEV